MTLFFELVIIAFLLLIAIELLLIYRELVHSQAVRDKGLSEKEDKSAAGQTINVNVASPAGLGGSGFPVTGSVLPGAVLAGTASQPNQARSGADESDQSRGNNTVSPVSDRDEGAMGGSGASPYRTGPRSPSAAQTRAANPFAKTCASCGAENSVYRTECFNCGKAL